MDGWIDGWVDVCIYDFFACGHVCIRIRGYTGDSLEITYTFESARLLVRLVRDGFVSLQQDP